VLATTSLWDRLPDEIVLAILRWVANGDAKAMLTVVPAVCRRWRVLCGDTRDVRFDLTFLSDRARLRDPALDLDGVAEAATMASLDSLATRFKHVVEWNLDRIFVPKLFAPFDVRPKRLQDSIAIKIAERCPRLIKLNYAWCLHLSDYGVIALARSCPQLTSVNMRNSFDLTDIGVVELAERCLKLTDVNFNGCRRLTDASVMTLAEYHPLLTSVDFGGCNQFTDESLFVLAERCPLLTNICFCASFDVTDAGVVALSERSSTCRALGSVDQREV
jgi:hypothetical protein